MDGDGILYQEDVEAACLRCTLCFLILQKFFGSRGQVLGARILPGYASGFSNHNMPYTTGEADILYILTEVG